MRTGAEGFAIPAALMVLLAATASGYLIHYLALQEMAVARAERDLLIAGMAAEGGLRIATRSHADSVTSLTLHDSVVVEGVLGSQGAYRVTGRRLANEIYLLEARGDAGTTVRTHVRQLLWGLDPGTRIAAFPAAAAAAAGVTVPDSTAIDGGTVTIPPLAWTAADCAPHQALADSLFPTGRVASSALWTPPATAPDSARAAHAARGADAEALSLGVLSLEHLAAVSEVTLGASGDSSQVNMGGGCPATRNGLWGTPHDPSGSCGSYFPLVVVFGSLELTGGQGQGVLVVEGDATLRTGTTFAGLVLAAGTIRLSGNARLAGWVRSGEEVIVSDSARVEASACAGLRALAHPRLRALYAMPAGSWLGPAHFAGP